jgi:hypothetical protein
MCVTFGRVSPDSNHPYPCSWSKVCPVLAAVWRGARTIFLMFTQRVLRTKRSSTAMILEMVGLLRHNLTPPSQVSEKLLSDLASDLIPQGLCHLLSESKAGFSRAFPQPKRFAQTNDGNFLQSLRIKLTRVCPYSIEQLNDLTISVGWGLNRAGS